MKRLDEYWYQRSIVSRILAPIALLFCSLVYIRRFLYRSRLFKTNHLAVPVIIIGNITVGGSGKTPLVIALVQLLKQAGYKPGVISRGYGGQSTTWPQQVREDSDPGIVGDEPILIAQNCQVPMAVGPNRVTAAKQLLQHHSCNIIVSDDGLQHYALGRDIEIAVVDGIRRHGNGKCLPAGPLREPLKRLKEMDYVVTNGEDKRDEYPMELIASDMINLHSNEKKSLEYFYDRKVNAVAGIGNPQRFFNLLKLHGIKPQSHPFPDHHDFSANDLDFTDNLPVLMTEKDAVKCQRFSNDKMWYLPVKAVLDEGFILQFLNHVKKIVK